MALKIGFAVLTLGTMLLGSTAAQAEEKKGVNDWAHQEAERRGGNHHDDRGHGGGNGYGHVEVHVHRDDCRHGPAPLPPPRARGRYELQTVNRWVEGRHERVWVPEVCEERHRRRSRVTRCTGGFYENRWVPARYEQVQEWVWVSYGRDGGYRSNRTHAASYYP
ncbi:hypothetical protein [Pyxidicoccus xibeiensis]|uniref:hypothetical protein n=1 Tax=Pyxidicoccus xibeiensis TaxID=2906759 RepID=UPI0020A7E97F|nr:hypothetical protein [Pyxidicoccus xibeiensis]MCP3139827.1 hypothetical protein [Pyxidicoccus xibeiensis]